LCSKGDDITRFDGTIQAVLIFFQKFAEIFTAQGAPPVSSTPVAKFAASVVVTGGELSLILVVHLYL
jgi:hypothetical protein